MQRRVGVEELIKKTEKVRECHGLHGEIARSHFSVPAKAHTGILDAHVP